MCDNAAVPLGEGYNRRARKALHIAGGLIALAVPRVPYWFGLLAAAGMVALSFWLRPHHAWWLRYISKPEDRIHNRITGLRGYALAVLLLVLLWPALNYAGLQAPRYVMLGWMALAFGDGLAGLVGPGPRVARTVPWNRYKTWWGLLGCFAGVLAGYALSFGLPYPCGAARSLAQLAASGPLLAALVALLESLDTRALRRRLHVKLDDNYLVGLGAPLLAGLLHALAG